jgi:hypothetical protein
VNRQRGWDSRLIFRAKIVKPLMRSPRRPDTMVAAVTILQIGPEALSCQSLFLLHRRTILGRSVSPGRSSAINNVDLMNIR